MIPYFFFGFFDAIEEVVEKYTGGWIASPKERTKEQVEAERIRLGIVEVKKEVKRITRILTEAKQDKASQKQIASLLTHESILKQQLQESRQAYDALLLRITSNAIQQKLIEQQLIEEALQEQALAIAEVESMAREIAEQQRLRQQEEDDIVFVMSMLSVM